MWWVILGVYLVGVVFTARKAAYYFAVADADLGDDVEMRAANRVMAFALGLVWPVAVVVAVVTGKLPKTPEALRKEVAARDARIAELERELGIGDG